MVKQNSTDRQLIGCTFVNYTMSVKHWGEIPPIRDEDLEISGITKIEREQIVKMRQVDVVGAKLYNNTCQIVSEPKIFEDTIPCKRTLHTIQLSKYYKQLESLLQDLHKQNEQTSVEEADKNLPAIPNVPETPDIKPLKTQVIPKSFPESLSHKLFKSNAHHSDSSPSASINQSYFEKSDFAQGIGEPPLSISGSVAWATLKKAIATILAHAGFDGATDVVLDNLTDAAQHFIIKLCQSFNYNAFLKLYPEETLFPAALECTLQESGRGGMNEIQNFYETHVIQYHKLMIKDCIVLRRECEMLRNSKIKAEQPTSEIKKEKIEITQDLTEEDQGSLPGTSQILMQVDESEKVLFNEPEISNWQKESIGPMFESGMSIPNLDFTKEVNIHDASLQSLSSSLDITQSNGLFSASNSPSSASDNSRSLKPPRKKKKI